MTYPPRFVFRNLKCDATIFVVGKKIKIARRDKYNNESVKLQCKSQAHHGRGRSVTIHALAYKCANKCKQSKQQRHL